MAKILLIEDDAAIAAIERDYLEIEGFEVEIVADGRVGLERGLEAMGDNATVAVHINRLREKLEKDPSNPRYIETVWGAGYRFRG